MANDFSGPELASQTRYHAIVGQVVGQDPVNADCNVQNIGNQHVSVADSTDGVVLDICVLDWRNLLTTLSAHILNNKGLGIKLKNDPAADQPVKVEINGELVEVKRGDDGKIIIPASIRVVPSDDIIVKYWVFRPVESKE